MEADNGLDNASMPRSIDDIYEDLDFKKEKLKLKKTIKPFKGVFAPGWVIERWEKNKMIAGKCLFHVDEFTNHYIHTSRVVKIKNKGSYSIAETRNSIYVLINPSSALSDTWNQINPRVP